MPPKIPARLEVGLSKKHLPSLDGLRAVAAFAVVFYHCGFLWCPGGTGVLAFFVLSGFLITWLLLEEEERTGLISLKFFYIRRSLRIFPAFYSYWLLFVGLITLLRKRLVFGQAIASFFYVSNYYQAILGDPNTGLSHTWSLGIEEQFYLLWPFVCVICSRNRIRFQLLATAIVAIWVYREILVFAFHANQGYVYEAFDTRADHLLIGCVLAVVLRERMWARLWSWLCFSRNMVSVTVGLLVLSTVAQLRLGTAYRDGVAFIIDPVLVAILIVQTITFADRGIGRFLNLRVMTYLGTISYSIYLYQQLGLDLGKKSLQSWPILSVLLSVASVILAASLSYWLVEKPFLRVKNRFAIGETRFGRVGSKLAENPAATVT